MTINEWYKIQVKNLPDPTKAWGKQYKKKFEKNLMDVLKDDYIFIDDMIVLAMYVDLEFDERLYHSLWQLETEGKIDIIHFCDCIALKRKT